MHGHKYYMRHSFNEHISLVLAGVVATYEIGEEAQKVTSIERQHSSSGHK